MPTITNSLLGNYGPWPRSFTAAFPDTGLFVLCGANNSGKSSLLQLCFSATEGSILVPTERGLLVGHVTPVGALADAREVFKMAVKRGPIDTALMSSDSNDQMSKYTSRLTSLLVNDQSLFSAAMSLNRELAFFNLPAIDFGRGNQSLLMGDKLITQQGTGPRSLLTILAALIHPNYPIILIDEPEFALEPSIQRQLSSKLLEYAQNKLIIIATHSHLFLNRAEGQHGNNYKVAKDGSNASSLIPCISPLDLQDLTFNLLGNSLEDLFLPANYLIVEGYSDQVICKKVLDLLNKQGRFVQIVSAGGITNVSNKFRAVCEQVLPLIMSSSPYSKRVVALVDAVDTNDKGQMDAVDKLEKSLGSRLRKLDVPSVEEYLPEDLYRRAGMNKTNELQALKASGGNIKDERSIKEKISNLIADVLSEEDLDTIPLIKEAVEETIRLSQ